MKSQLHIGNHALRDSNFVTAIQCYLRVLEESPSLGRYVAYNIGMAQRGMQLRRTSPAGRRVAVCAWDLASSANRAHTLCLLHERSAHVELIACVKPGAAAEQSLPALDTRFARHLVAGEGDGFIERALRLVAEHPFDLVHVTHPRAPNLVIGLLYQLVWGARVLVDFDDDVMRAEAGADPGAEAKPSVAWPAAHALADQDWTRIALGLALQLDGVTVSNPALRSRFGGTLLHHARDEALFESTDTLRAAGRRRMDLGAAATVVLLCATQRSPAVLLEVGRAVAALELKDLALVVTGTMADAQAAVEQLARQGVACRLLGDVPFDVMPELMAASDVHVILQEPKFGSGAARLPGSLTEALLAGLPVVARLAPGLLVEPLRQAVIDAAAAPLTDCLHQALRARPAAERRQDAVATGLTQLLGLSHNAAALQTLCATVGTSEVPPMAADSLAALDALHAPRWLQAVLVLRGPPMAASSDKGGDEALGAPKAREPEPKPAAAASLKSGTSLAPAQAARAMPAASPRLPDWTTCDGLLPTPAAAVVELLGQSLCLLPTTATADAERDLEVLRAFAGLHGRADRDAIRLRRHGQAHTLSAGEGPGRLAWPARCSNWRLERAGLLLGDIWFANDHTLRLRLEVPPDVALPAARVWRAFQVQPGHDALCIGAETLLTSLGPVFVDVALVNPYWPVLFLVTDLEGLWLDTTLLPFPSLSRGGAHHGELASVGELPVGMNQLEALSNSLAAELVGWPEAPLALSLGSLQIDLCNATGAERIFSPLVHEWLGEIMQVGTMYSAGAESAVSEDVGEHLSQACALQLPEGAGAEARRRVQARTRDGALVLQLAADSLPTISALVSRRLSLQADCRRMPGAWVVAHPATGKPRALVSVPDLGETLFDLQPQGQPLAFPLLHRRQGMFANAPDGNATGGRAPFPLAVRFREGLREPQAVLLQPLSADSGRQVLRRSMNTTQRQSAAVSVLLHLGDGEVAEESLLDSLARQSLSDALQVVVVLAPSRALELDRLRELLGRLFPGRAEVLCADTATVSAGLNLAASRASSDQLLVVGAGTVMHDPRTLEVLHTLVLEPGVATAACVLLREVAVKRGHEARFCSGGFFPAGLSFSSQPALVLHEPYSADALPLATYPVVGNSFRLAMVDAQVWRELGGLDAGRFPGHRADIDFCLRALRSGRSHLCTSAISASMLSPGQAEQHCDTHATGFMPLQRWHDVLDAVTLIRDFES